MVWVKRTSKPIPSMGSRSNIFEYNDYSKGMDSFTGNDKFPETNGGTNRWRLAQDARITTLGEYETRKGFDFHSAAAGETQDQAITSTTGAADKDFSETARLAQKWTCGTSGRLSKLEVNIKNSATATGTIIVEHWTDDGGEPGALVARSSIDASSLSTSYGYLTARFPDAPTITAATAYWVVLYVQSYGAGSYRWSSTTTATTAMTSSDSGSTWASTSYALNFKQHYATTGGVKGFIRTMKSDGTKVTLFAHGTVLYSVDEVTGALTSVKTGLSASATQYEFCKVNDVVYYVNGYDGLRKWDFTTESQVSATNYDLVCEHKGCLFLLDGTDNNKVVYSNFADYETFTSTDLLYVPSPKTGDPVTAMISLNGNLLFFTKNNKFILFGDDNATFSLSEAPDQKGTYTQRTVTADDNYVYFLSDDGVYRSNGTEPQMLSENIYQDIITLNNRESATLCVNRGRLYVWYRSAGSSNNDECFVWNLNFASQSDTIESKDTNAFVTQAQTATNDSDALIVASSVIGQIYWQEDEANDYTNLGGDINYLLEQHYSPFSVPSVLKEVRDWKARFGAQSGSYTIRCEYAYDQRDNWQLQSAHDVLGSGYIWGSPSTVWGAFSWGTSAETQASLYIPGEYRRIAVRYKHYAARQPHKFLGHTFVVQQRRMK